MFFFLTKKMASSCYADGLRSNHVTIVLTKLMEPRPILSFTSVHFLVCVHAHMHACVRASAPARVCLSVYVYFSTCAFKRACPRSYRVRACRVCACRVCACPRAFVPACVLDRMYARVRACPPAYGLVLLLNVTSSHVSRKILCTRTKSVDSVLGTRKHLYRADIVGNCDY